MKLYRFALILILPLMVSCVYDYDFEEEFSPSIVINSTITPDSTIKVYLHWSKHVDDTSNFKRVERFTGQIYKDGEPILEGNELNGANGLLTSQKHPEAGFKYRLEVDVPDYGRVSAETSIPSIPIVDLEYTKVLYDPSYRYHFHYFNITKIELSTTTRSVMIRSTAFYEEHAPEHSRDFYANNSFFDQFNTYINMDHDVAVTGSSTAFEDYIRIPYKNLELSLPLNFSANDREAYSFVTIDPDLIIGSDSWGDIIGYDDLGYAIYFEDYKTEQSTRFKVDIIAPSDEYDKFYKSAYFQKSWDSGGVYIGSFPIESNVENGVGCFMGYSSASKTYKIDRDE